MRLAEVHRAVLVAGAADQDPPVLATLVAGSPEPWSSILDDQRVLLLGLAGEVASTSASTHGLAVTCLDRLFHLGHREMDADRSGARRRNHPSAASPTPTHVALRRPRPMSRTHRTSAFDDLDELDREVVAIGYRTLASATERMALPSLTTFLR